MSNPDSGQSVSHRVGSKRIFLNSTQVTEAEAISNVTTLLDANVGAINELQRLMKSKAAEGNLEPLVRFRENMCRAVQW